jgi:AcrR family transcriptional regulator
VTKPIVYRHFGSKKALYIALLEQHEADLPGFLAGAEEAAAEDPAEEVLRSILDRWLDYVRLNSHAWLMLFRDSSGDEEIRALRRRVSLRAREVLAGYLRSRGPGVEGGERIEPTAEVLRSGLVGLALWWIDRPEVPKQVPLEVAVAFAAATAASWTRTPGVPID